MATQARTRLPWPVFVCALLAAGPAQAEQYVVDGFSLGSRIAQDDTNLKSYACRPSGQYDDTVVCTRQQKKKGRAGTLTLSSALLKAKDGTELFARVHLAPVKLNRSALDA